MAHRILLALAMGLVASSAAADITVFTGPNHEWSISDPVAVGDGSEELFAVTLSVENISGSGAFDIKGWNSADTGLGGIAGNLHQHYSSIFGFGSPTDASGFATSIDTHFLLSGQPLFFGTSMPAEDYGPTPSNEPSDLGPPIDAFADTDFGSYLTMTGSLSGPATPRWDIAQIVAPFGSPIAIQTRLDMDAAPSELIDFGFVIDQSGGTADPHWISPAGGSWDVAENWQPDVVPTFLHEVFITPEHGLTVTGPTSSTDIVSLTIGAQINVAELALQPGTTLNATEEVTLRVGSRLSGDGSLTTDTLQVHGEVDLGAPSLVQSSILTNDGTLRGAGSIVAPSLANHGQIDLSGGLQLNGALLTNDGVISGGGTISQSVRNQGSGRIEVLSGQTLTFDGSVEHQSGEINTQAGGSTIFNGTLSAGGSFTGGAWSQSVAISASKDHRKRLTLAGTSRSAPVPIRDSESAVRHRGQIWIISTSLVPWI